MTREAQVTRNTKETQISLKLGLDGSGKSSLDNHNMTNKITDNDYHKN